MSSYDDLMTDKMFSGIEYLLENITEPSEEEEILMDKVIDAWSRITKKEALPTKIPKKNIAGKINCEECEDGIISYTISSCNGHLSGKCSTTGCLCWDE